MTLLILFISLLAIEGPTDPTKSARPPSTSRKNVLLIAIDDLRPELGCYGAEHAQSPNIDRLASRGVTFLNHFAQVPTCGASRYALLTGRSPIFSQAKNNNACFGGPSRFCQSRLPAPQTMPELFRNSGYHTVCIGKISHTPDGRVFAYNGSGDGRDELPNAWDELPTPFGSWKRGWGTFFAYANGLHREDGKGHRDLMEFVVENDDDLPDGMMATAAIDQLKALKDSPQPFFLGLGFFKPHLPFVATKQDWQAFEKTSIPLPPQNYATDSRYANQRSGEFFGYRFPYDKKQRPLSNQYVLQNRRAYLACVRYVDRQVGRVLDALEESGLAESTIVVLWSDHGWNLGDARQWGKHTTLDRALRCPLIISVPNMNSAGRQSNSLVESVDVLPTLMELCQPKIAQMARPVDGASLVPILTDPTASVRQHSFSYWQNQVSVRTQDLRLIGRLAQTKKQYFNLLGQQYETEASILRRIQSTRLQGIEVYARERHFDPHRNLAKFHAANRSLLVEAFRNHLLDHYGF